jgi:uncharacterized protein (DUF2147 family)
MTQFRILTLSAVLVLFSFFTQAEVVKPPAANTAATTSASATALVVVPVTASDLNSAVGKWKSIDDETGKPKSIIEITEGSDAKLNGKIVQLFREPSEEQNPKCDKCTGDKKDQPILNMQIMHGFKKKSDGKWADGEILDPKNGKVYSCKLALTEGGKKLEVRGFIGFSLLGRTQIWLRD